MAYRSILFYYLFFLFPSAVTALCSELQHYLDCEVLQESWRSIRNLIPLILSSLIGYLVFSCLCCPWKYVWVSIHWLSLSFRGPFQCHQFTWGIIFCVLCYDFFMWSFLSVNSLLLKLILVCCWTSQIDSLFFSDFSSLSFPLFFPDIS